MKAAVIHRFGGPKKIALIDLPTLLLGAGQVLIKGLAALVSQNAHKTRQGRDQ
ncbi:hypothetical protein [Pseudomonas sp. EL_65y_Pfl2_R95]|uniref:hypothetical protein n=1 Tax=Pseudomonas sp. EL_65y_Pfl2_R95 TaxID=3088698 RepID=UPI0030D9DBE7